MCRSKFRTLWIFALFHKTVHRFEKFFPIINRFFSAHWYSAKIQSVLVLIPHPVFRKVRRYPQRTTKWWNRQFPFQSLEPDLNFYFARSKSVVCKLGVKVIQDTWVNKLILTIFPSLSKPRSCFGVIFAIYSTFQVSPARNDFLLL